MTEPTEPAAAHAEGEKCFHPGCLREATRQVWTTQGNGSALLAFCDVHPKAGPSAPGSILSARA